MSSSLAITPLTGTYAIPLNQTLVDGHPVDDLDDVKAGSTWTWHGAAHRLDGPDSIVPLPAAIGEQDFRRRVARTAQRFAFQKRQDTTNLHEVEVQLPLDISGFVVTNGAQVFRVSVIVSELHCAPLVVFYDGIPPRHTEFWIAECDLSALTADARSARGMICFTPGTQIATPTGPRDVSDLRFGDLVQTKDNGVRPVVWTGRQHLSGVRLQVCPWLRPVRVSASAFGTNRPSCDLIVSPRHRVLVRKDAADRLFGEHEVLVHAEDLLTTRLARQDICPDGVTYCHIMLDSHEILFANGLETESFNPTDADTAALGEADKAALHRALQDRASQGVARRCLTKSEAALVMHNAA